MATVRLPAEQQLLLGGVDWPTYTRLLRALDHRPGVRLTYDRGSLEIMTLSYAHEVLVRLLDRLVVALTEECGLALQGGRSTTLRRRKRRRGLEPDDCYWITSEPLVRGKDQIDLRRDPPPDLALEIDVSRSSLDRMAIYAKLETPEVWRCDGQMLTCYLLGPTGQYTESTASRVFPGLNPADLVRFLALRGQMDENALVRQFRAWCGSSGEPAGARALPDWLCRLHSQGRIGHGRRSASSKPGTFAEGCRCLAKATVMETWENMPTIPQRGISGIYSHDSQARDALSEPKAPGRIRKRMAGFACTLTPQ